MYFNYIEDAYYINLDSRVDRRTAFENRCKKIGITPNRFAAIQLKKEECPDPWNDKDWHKKISSTLSHQTIIQLAKDKGLNNVWIFEDDCVFIDSFMDKVQKCIAELKHLEWDMFFFGGEPNKKAIPYSNNIVKTNGVYGAHCYLINSTFYDKMLAIPYQAGLMDIHYLVYNEDEKQFFLSKELLAWQDDTLISDLWGTKDGETIYRNAYKKYIDEKS